jgi:hypothetical protein
MTMSNRVTLWPTYPGDPPNTGGHEDDGWTDDAGGDLQTRTITACREIGADGAHVFTGSHGAIYGEEGYEDNYCGWIDAREAPIITHRAADMRLPQHQTSDHRRGWMGS